MEFSKCTFLKPQIEVKWSSIYSSKYITWTNEHDRLDKCLLFVVFVYVVRLVSISCYVYNIIILLFSCYVHSSYVRFVVSNIHLVYDRYCGVNTFLGPSCWRVTETYFWKGRRCAQHSQCHRGRSSCRWMFVTCIFLLKTFIPCHCIYQHLLVFMSA